MENRMNRKHIVLILMFIMEMPISREQEEGQGRSNPPCRVTNQQTSETFARIILFSRFINEMSLPWFLLSWLGSFLFKIWLFYPQISFFLLFFFSCRRDLSCLRSLVTEGSLNTNPSSRLLYSSGRCQQPLDVFLVISSPKLLPLPQTSPILSEAPERTDSTSVQRKEARPTKLLTTASPPACLPAYPLHSSKLTKPGNQQWWTFFS